MLTNAIIIKKIILTSSLTVVALLLHSQWQWQNPLLQGHDLKALCFINQNMGWAVGDFGTIIYTNNGGISGGEEFIIQNPKFNIQCYPNPFSKKTGRENDFVSIILFN